MKLTSIIKELNKIQISTTQCNTINMCIVTNLCLEPFFSKLLQLTFGRAQINVNIAYLDILDINYKDKALLLENSDIVAIFINYERKYCYKKNLLDFNHILSDTLEYINLVKAYSHKQCIWIGYEDFSLHHNQIWGNIITQNDIIDSINYKVNNKVNNITVINLKQLIAMLGISNALDYHNFHKWGTLYSSSLLNILSEELLFLYKSNLPTEKKCIVLDCDNVLWGGNVSDLGINNIQLGNTYQGILYQKFQKLLLHFFERGIILVLCSKNDEKEVLDVFQKNSQMLLSLSNIAAYKINWGDKSQNVRQLSEELNIDTQHMVFIDDSDFEVANMKESIPDIYTIKFSIDSIFYNLKHFYLSEKSDIHDSIIRTETYKKNGIRKKILSNNESIEQYLQQIENSYTICKTSENELKRISDLSLRTNRFSSHKRYNLQQVISLYETRTYDLFSVYVSDKYGDLGLVGCIGINTQKNELNLFCLSCRALGRNIEKHMIDFIKEKYNIDQIFFSKNEKNIFLFDLLKENYGEVIFYE